MKLTIDRGLSYALNHLNLLRYGELPYHPKESQFITKTAGPLRSWSYRSLTKIEATSPKVIGRNSHREDVVRVERVFRFFFGDEDYDFILGVIFKLSAIAYEGDSSRGPILWDLVRFGYSRGLPPPGFAFEDWVEIECNTDRVIESDEKLGIIYKLPKARPKMP